MRNKSAYFFILLLIFSSYIVSGQGRPDPTESGGEYQFAGNDAAHPCVAEAEYDRIQQDCAANARRLGLDGIAHKTESVMLGWPLRQANGLHDYSYYRIAAYVDEDTATTNIKDWNCGSNTYDTHRGTDIATYPFPFYKLDNNQVEVIAAAAGTIVSKSDGFTDKNCASNNLTANYIVIQHADASVAQYFHMKKNSVTTKAIGQTVAAGEYLGVVASSGDATGPHLHFEVRKVLYGAVIDPYAGTCNIHNSTTWWAAQKPYTEPAVVRVQINSINTPPTFPACPATESPNDDSCFAAGDHVQLYTFFRSETAGLTATFRIFDPTGAVFSTWTHSSASTYSASYYTYTRTLPATVGVYTFQAIYNGDTCTKTFKVNCAATTTGAEQIADISPVRIYPNPASDRINISGEGMENGAGKITIRNTLGQILLSENIKVENGMIQKSYSMSELPKAMYILTLETGSSVIIRKIEKSN